MGPPEAFERTARVLQIEISALKKVSGNDCLLLETCITLWSKPNDGRNAKVDSNYGSFWWWKCIWHLACNFLQFIRGYWSNWCIPLWQMSTFSHAVRYFSHTNKSWLFTWTMSPSWGWKLHWTDIWALQLTYSSHYLISQQFTLIFLNFFCTVQCHFIYMLLAGV